MASITVKRNKKGEKYYIVQQYRDEDGNRCQRWIPCQSRADAYTILPDVEEAERSNRIYERPRYAKNEPIHYAAAAPQEEITVKVLVEQYAKRHCAEGGWEAHSAAANEGLLNNYVFPLIGDEPIANITTYYMQQFYDDLQTKDSVKPKQGKIVKVSARTVRDIHKILHPAFDYAVRNGLLSINPSNGIKLPKLEKFKRKQWTREEVLEGMKSCADPDLLLMIGIMYDCTLRSGEVLGMTWDELVLPENGELGTIHVRNELARLRKDKIQETKTIVHFTFPDIKQGATTSLVLKDPKTDESNRLNYISPTVVRMLLAKKRKQEQMKALLGSDFQDFNLVFCQDNGRPISSELLVKRFKQYLNITSLKEIEFYSLRHSGATSQMDLSGNDIKAVQQNMGHSTTDMLMKVYLAPVDKKRQGIAMMMEEQVFSQLEWEKTFGIENAIENKEND